MKSQASENLENPSNDTEDDQASYDTDRWHHLYQQYQRPDSLFRDSKLSGTKGSRASNYSSNVQIESRGSYLNDGLDSRLLRSIDIPMFDSPSTQISNDGISDIDYPNRGSNDMSEHSPYLSDDKVPSPNANIYCDGSKHLIEIHIEPLKDSSLGSTSQSRSSSNPLWEGTHFLMAHYRAQSRISSASSLRSSDLPVMNAPQLTLEKKQLSHFQNSLTLKQGKTNSGSKKKKSSNKIVGPKGKVERSLFSMSGRKTASKENTSLSRRVGRERNNGESGGLTDMKKRKLLKKKMSEGSSLRILEAGELCGSDGCQMCIMAKHCIQGQVKFRLGGRFFI